MFQRKNGKENHNYATIIYQMNLTEYAGSWLLQFRSKDLLFTKSMWLSFKGFIWYVRIKSKATECD